MKKRRKVKRAAAMFLAALLTVNSVDLTVFTVYAKEQDKDVVTITGFEELEESIANQRLAIGAAEEEIVFPDTLDVTVRVPVSEGVSEK